MCDILRATLFAAIEEQYADQLAERIEQVKHEHQIRVEATLDKALAAITGEKPEKPKAKAPRKPRADKGRKRMGKGLPPAPPAPEEKSDEPCCADCEHYRSLHEGGDGECGVSGCGCPVFISESEVGAP
jgi:hypothetical protein